MSTIAASRTLFTSPIRLFISITRAKKEQHLFISGETSQWNNDLLLVRYVETIKQQYAQSQPIQSSNSTASDAFAQAVTKYLQALGITDIRHQTTVAGFPVDLLIEYRDKRYGIDLVGYPGDNGSAFTLERYRMLSRIGIGTFVLPYTKWMIEPHICQQELKIFLDQT